MANEGIHGALDFVGYPTGQGTPVPVPPIVPGLYPFDFVGYPIGVPRPSARTGRGTAVGGRRIQPLLVHMALERSLLDHLTLTRSQQHLQRLHRDQLFRQRVKAIEERRERRQIEVAVFSALLGEI